MSKMQVYEANGVTFTRTSDNIFADLGLPNADELLLKSDLVIAILRVTRERGLALEEVAALLEMPTNLVYDALCGDFDTVSVAQMLTMLKALGMNVSVVVTPEEPDAAQANTESAAASYAAT